VIVSSSVDLRHHDRTLAIFICYHPAISELLVAQADPASALPFWIDRLGAVSHLS
jgi:hypothetical protein